MPRRLILASASPRRRELLSLLGLPFEVIPSDVDETPLVRPSHELVADLSIRKAEAALRDSGYDTSAVVLAADTVVVTERPGIPTVLNKPGDAEDAKRMLRLLSGDTHTVYTGVTLARAYPWEEAGMHPGIYSGVTEVVDTQVTFRELSDELIEAYIATGEPFDKAGAYGIQGFASTFVTAIYGDYFNVVGLPICTVARMLESLGIEWWRGPAALR